MKSRFFISVLLVLSGCTESVVTDPAPTVTPQEVEIFASGIKARLVFVKGGQFLMGDFGIDYAKEGLPLDAESHSKPLHEIKLSGYYIDKYKVTNSDFAFYLRFHGQTLRTDVPKGNFVSYSSHPRLPASLDWFEAEKYCTWLSSITDLPFSLATEAQWEYAARNRGKFVMVATDDGSYRYRSSGAGEFVGVNISSSRDREEFSKAQGWDTGSTTLLPVDQFPPNPLGVYAMSDNGIEWVKDWYDPDYYETSPLENPQGPARPTHKDYLGRYTKVMRGQTAANEYWTVGVNVHRQPYNPYGYGRDDKSVRITGRTARCVVNSEEPFN